MNALELRYALRSLLMSKYAPEEIDGVELLGPQGDGTVRMRVTTTDPVGEPRTYTVSIQED